MRQKVVFATSRREAKKECPWAAHICKVCGGYICFESHNDYNTWRKQK